MLGFSLSNFTSFYMMWYDGMGMAKMKWKDGIQWDGMEKDGMGWDGMGKNGIGWDGMGKDGIGWDGMGKDGVGIVGGPSKPYFFPPFVSNIMEKLKNNREPIRNDTLTFSGNPWKIQMRTCPVFPPQVYHSFQICTLAFQTGSSSWPLCLTHVH